MSTDVKKQRKIIISKINALLDTCTCKNGNKKKCNSCKSILSLGKELGNVGKKNKPKRVYVKHNQERIEAVAKREFTLRVPRRRMRGKLCLDWSMHSEYLEENAHLYTIEEMSKMLDVTPRDLRNKYNRDGLEYKKDASKIAVIYDFLIADEFITRGSIRDISKATGKADSTLKRWTSKQGKQGERLVVVNE